MFQTELEMEESQVDKCSTLNPRHRLGRRRHRGITPTFRVPAQKEERKLTRPTSFKNTKRQKTNKKHRKPRALNRPKLSKTKQTSLFHRGVTPYIKDKILQKT